jgi:uncharacterized protein (DUF885 family)
MAYRSTCFSLIAVLASGLATPAVGQIQERNVTPPDGWADDVPVISALVAHSREESDLRTVVTRYIEDRAAIKRRYPVEFSPIRNERLRKFHESWRRQLDDVDFDSLNHEGQIDYILLRNRINHDLDVLRLVERNSADLSRLIPFRDQIRQLEEQRLDKKRVEARPAATALNEIAKQSRDLAASFGEESNDAAETSESGVSRDVALRASEQLTHLLETLTNWYTFYDGYDPEFTWWMERPFAAAESDIAEYAGVLRKFAVGAEAGDTVPIVGAPVLAEGLQADLELEMIPYNAKELISIGEEEFKWIEDRMLDVSREMGFGDDWKAAIEHTKNLAPPPGEIPWVLYDIAEYSENFIEDLGTIDLPPLSREIWRFTMQTPERQLINPFFTGGEVTHLSYPTNTMDHEQKMMSMRGNTPHFNFPTVQHELVPGHHLQSFMYNRFNSHRAELNRTPFWMEGWALYWEFTLWDEDFSRNNPDKIGMLFWRMHRAARIVFSLNYQLGNWSAQQCVDFLVDRVGHERANAEAEVRRSARAAPLYQAAYMLGALQIRALHRELVQSGNLSEKDFHNGFLIGGPMPIEMVRARMTGQDLSRDYESSWRFYEGR